MRKWLLAWARVLLREEIATDLRVARREGHSKGLKQGLKSRIAHRRTMTLADFNALMARGKPTNLAIVGCTIIGDQGESGRGW